MLLYQIVYSITHLKIYNISIVFEEIVNKIHFNNQSRITT